MKLGSDPGHGEARCSARSERELGQFEMAARCHNIINNKRYAADGLSNVIRL
jgi:hypothetical protein